jgi:hypothetical protein
LDVSEKFTYLYFFTVDFAKKDFGVRSRFADIVHARGRRKSIHLGGYDVPAISTGRRFIETPREFYRGPLIDLSGCLLPTADLSGSKERPYARKEESRR